MILQLIKCKKKLECSVGIKEEYEIFVFWVCPPRIAPPIMSTRVAIVSFDSLLCGEQILFFL